jgi:hypothetical protein
MRVWLPRGRRNPMAGAVARALCLNAGIARAYLRGSAVIGNQPVQSDGTDLRGSPLDERKKSLARVVRRRQRVRGTGTGMGYAALSRISRASFSWYLAMITITAYSSDRLRALWSVQRTRFPLHTRRCRRA